jgi:Calcineurin-like phosphoesterase
MSHNKKVPVHWMSDLHLEHSNFDLHSTIDSGILLLIGDISADFTLLDAFFRKLNENVKAVYIPGNHEYENKTFQEVVPFLKELLSVYPNVTVLDNESCVIDSIKIIGSTLWSNFDITDHFTRRDMMKRADELFSDFTRGRFIEEGNLRRFTVYDSLEQFDRSYKYIEFELTKNRVDMPTIVATHFSPSNLSRHPKFGDSAMNAYWHNKIDHLIPLANYWFHGHTHETMEYMVEETFVGCNPRGTSKMLNLSSNEKFDANRSVDVEVSPQNTPPRY